MREGSIADPPWPLVVAKGSDSALVFWARDFIATLMSASMSAVNSEMFMFRSMLRAPANASVSLAVRGSLDSFGISLSSMTLRYFSQMLIFQSMEIVLRFNQMLDVVIS
jgi:hypothetical protein